MGFSALARTGETAPGTTSVFRRFFDPTFNAEGSAAWIGTLEGVPAREQTGLWFRQAGAPAPVLVAREGGEVEGRFGTRWQSIRSLVLPDGDGPVFSAYQKIEHSPTRKELREGLWHRGLDGKLRLILHKGEPIPFGKTERKVKHFKVLGRVSGTPDFPRAYNFESTVICLVTFEDRNQAVVALPLL
jgi:hypothetical protein